MGAVGRATLDTIQVTGPVSHLACARQESTEAAKLLRATRAQTDQAMPFTPAAGRHTQLIAQGAVSKDICQMGTLEHTRIPCKAVAGGISAAPYFDAMSYGTAHHPHCHPAGQG
jgi:hypothetical protein